ncbi:MAG TPA: hypothetical protein VFO60_04570 [Candidatus Dormibacteraeota bacterium]|nr:hypothetical protein [Candidatus Dormibacteraeota bacterium]
MLVSARHVLRRDAGAGSRAGRIGERTWRRSCEDGLPHAVPFLSRTGNSVYVRSRTLESRDGAGLRDLAGLPGDGREVAVDPDDEVVMSPVSAFPPVRRKIAAPAVPLAGAGSCQQFPSTQPGDG